ncbi:MAG: AAA family ATPase [Finegoldia sp.]|nr:AAA family ATPase [Finegoldia sp.]
MKILRLDIKSFGKFHNFNIDFYDGLNLIEGRNESGKTTISKFIEGVFYGFTKPYTKRTVYTNDYEKYRPWDGEEYEGSIEIEYKSKVYIIYRDFKNKTYSIFDGQKGSEINDLEGFDKNNLAFPGEYFFCMPLDIFQATQKSDLYEITNYKESSQAISDFLINSNIDDTSNFSAKRAIEKLKKYKNEIGTKNSSNKPLGLLYKEKDKLESEISILRSNSNEVGVIEKKLKSLEEKNERLADNKKRLQVKDKKARIDKLDEVRSYKMKLLKERAELLEEINSLSYLQEIDIDDINKLQKNKESINGINKRYNDLYKEKTILEGDYVKSKDKIDLINNFRDSLEELRDSESKISKLTNRRNILSLILVAMIFVIYFLSNSLIFTIVMGLVSALLIGFVVFFYNFRIKHYQKGKMKKIATINLGLDTSMESSDELEAYMNGYNIEESYIYFNNLKDRLDELYESLDELEAYEKKLEKENKHLINENKSLSKVDINDYMVKLSGLDNLRDMVEEKDRELKRINADYDFSLLADESLDDVAEIREDDIGNLEILDKELESNIVSISKLKERYRNLQESSKLLMEKEESLFDVNKRIDEYNDELKALDLAQEIINKSSNRLQDSFIPRINDKVREMISLYLRSDKTYNLDENFNVNVFDGKKFHPQNNLSSGTLGQIALFIRIAILEELMGEDYMMIFDDAFVQLDYIRYTKTLKLLSQLSTTNQVIIFSCHLRESEILDELKVDYRKIGL